MCGGEGRLEGLLFYRGREGRPLSQFPFELRSRGSKRVGHMGKEYSR